MPLCALFSLLLLVGPFWEVKPPADWTVEELTKLFKRGTQLAFGPGSFGDFDFEYFM